MKDRMLGRKLRKREGVKAWAHARSPLPQKRKRISQNLGNRKRVEVKAKGGTVSSRSAKIFLLGIVRAKNTAWQATKTKKMCETLPLIEGASGRPLVPPRSDDKAPSGRGKK